MSEEFKIDITKPFDDFTKHLKLENNERIIFSGIFGIGKTYFLREYFNNFKCDYLTIRLSPINYSIASNEDIFRFIKYDILYELFLNKDFTIKDNKEFSEFIINYQYITTNFFDILKAFIHFIPAIGKDTKKAFDNVQKLYDDYQSMKNNIQEGEKRDVGDFTKDIDNSYLYEYDKITDFINSSLNKLAEIKSKDSPRKKVLVIDDMDRIDPEHIFRLFNVFSAHFDYRKESDNKFSFDKIIFVCDINNIRNIFKTKYGQDTDFSGYIDKFYCREVYHFDNKNKLGDIIHDILTSIKVEEGHKFLYDKLIGILIEILVSMISANAINIRNLLNLHGKQFVFQEKIVPFNINDISIRTFQLKGIRILEILVKIFGDSDNLVRAIKKTNDYRKECKIKDNWAGNLAKLAGDFILIINNKVHKFMETPQTYTFRSTNLNFKYQYKIKKIHDYYYAERVISSNEQESFLDHYYFYLMHDAAKLLKEMEVLM